MDNSKPENIQEEENNYYSSGLFDIEESPACKALVSLRNNPQSVDELKAQFLEFYNYFVGISGYQKEMTKKLKTIIDEVNAQRLEKDKQVSMQYAGNAEIADYKRELLKIQNEVNLSLEREAKYTAEIEDLSRQKQDLVRDIEEIRRMKADMLEPQLVAATKELRMDLMQRRHQVENLQKDMDEKQSIWDIVMQDRDRLEMEREKHALVLAKASETPLKIIKQIDVLRDALVSLGNENTKQLLLGMSLDRELERLAKRRRDLEDLRLGHAADYEQRQGLIHEMERQADDIFKEHELAKEQLAFQKAERVRLEQTLRKTVLEIKREHDLVLRVIREKDTFFKMHARLELSLNNIKLSTPPLLKQREDVKRQLASVKSDERYYKRETQKLRATIDHEMLDFLNQDRVEKSEAGSLQEQIMVNRKIGAEFEEATANCTQLGRQLEQLKVEKDYKDRELIRAKNKLRAAKNDWAIEELAIQDAQKRTSETQTNLKNFQTLYEQVKTERNKYRAAEMKEKIKILSNEIEILRHEIFVKDKELVKQKQDNTAKYAVRDTLKNEANKLMIAYRDKRDQINQHLSKIEALNAHINSCEDDMVSLKARYESSVKDRNMIGMHLLDRNDELCILYERLNIQKEIAAKGEAALVDREEEIRKLMLVGAELDRRIELEKRKLPLSRFTVQIDALEIERGKLHEVAVKLGKQMENPNDPKRTRNLPGEDPSQEELLSRIENLEELLALEDEKLLEKDLILEEVSVLVSRLETQTMAGKDETYQITSRINDLTKRLKQITRKTMAKVSELAMHQALAMSLYQEKSEKVYHLIRKHY